MLKQILFSILICLSLSSSIYAEDKNIKDIFEMLEYKTNEDESRLTIVIKLNEKIKINKIITKSILEKNVTASKLNIHAKQVFSIDNREYSMVQLTVGFYKDPQESISHFNLHRRASSNNGWTQTHGITAMNVNIDTNKRAKFHQNGDELYITFSSNSRWD